MERFSAWIALWADRFADRLEDWADGLQARHEAPGGPYRRRVEAPSETYSDLDGFEVLVAGDMSPGNARRALQPITNYYADKVGFLAEVARHDPRLAIALLGSVPPAPPAGKCSNCGAPHDVDRRCRYCGVERAGPLERPSPSDGKVYTG